jgi:rRNA maturation endonuclease Nob1
LTDAAFGSLSIVVIGVLAFMTVWIAMKTTIHHKPKQATLSQFMTTSNVHCIGCGTKLAPASKFCNNCGTRQP